MEAATLSRKLVSASSPTMSGALVTKEAPFFAREAKSLSPWRFDRYASPDFIALLGRLSMFSRREMLGSAAFTLIFPASAAAHGGGLNAQGCHNNRKTGDYHCHRAPSTATDEGASAYSSQRSSLLSSSTDRAQGSVHSTMAAQTALTSLGYDVGAIDGRMGAKTVAALRSFETGKGVASAGQINDATIFLLVEAIAEKVGC